MHKTLFLLLFSYFLLPVKAEVLCHKITSTLTIDGHLDEEVWQQGTGTEFLNQDQISTVFRFLNDEHYLYLGIVCQEPAIKEIRASVTKRDLNVYSDDSVEIFINPHRDSDQYLQLVVNSIGTIYDARIVGQSRDSSWNLTGFEVKTSTDNHAWNIEMRLPIAAFLSLLDTLPLRQAVSADSWSFNLVRNRYTGKRNSWSYAGVNHWLDRENYQALRGVTASYDQMHWAVNALSLISLQPDENIHPVELRGSIDNCTSKGKIIKILSSLVNAQNKHLTESFTSSQTVFIDRGQVFSFQHFAQLPAPGAYHCTLKLTDTRDNLLCLVQMPMLANYEELSLVLRQPGYRSAIYSMQKCPKLIFELKSDILTNVADTVQAEFSIIRSGGQEPLLKKTAPFNEFMRQPFAVSIPVLPPGTYNGRISAEISANHTASAQTQFIVHEPSPVETWVNEHGNIVRNGKPVFPVGSFNNYWHYVSKSDPVDFAIGYGPARDLSDDNTRQNLEQDEKAGRQYLWFPETRELWSHYAGPNKSISMRPIPPENAAKIKERLQQYLHAGFLFGWYMADEPSPSRVSPRYLQDMYELIQQATPYHPATMCFNSVNATKLFGSYCDIAIIDFFPGYHVKGREQPLENLALMLLDARKELEPCKPIISAIPLFPYTHTGKHLPRYPTYLESRCLVFLSLVCGAQGIAWNASYHFRCDLENFLGLPAVTREIKALQEVWLSNEKVALQLSGNDANSVHVAAKMLHGELYITAVNPHDRKISVEINLPAPLATLKLQELASPVSEVKQDDGKLFLDFEPLQVRLFSSDPTPPDLVAPEEIIAEISHRQKQFENSGNLCYFSRGSQLLFSEHYNTAMRVPAHQQCLLDGLHIKYLYGTPERNTPGDIYLGVEFPDSESISRVCISWDSINGAVPADEELRFRLEGTSSGDGSFQPIIIDSLSQQRDNDLLTCTITFNPILLKKFRLVFTGKHPILPQPSEIQAFQ